MGIGFVSGANGNDDLTGSGTDVNRRTGYIGGNGIDDHLSTDAPDVNGSYNPTGYGYQIDNGRMVAGTSVADQDVNRYRALGTATQPQVQLNQGQADESRGLQLGALHMMGVAAMGNAPSQAAETGTMNADAALRSRLGGLAGAVGGGPSGGARGVGSAITANTNAQAGAGQTMGSLAGVAANSRAAEVAHAQSGYAGAVQGARGQDISAATTNAQLVAQKRALDNARRQQYEQLAWGTRRTQSQGEDDFRTEQERQANAARLARDAQSAQDWSNIKDDGSMALSAIMASDERTKTSVVPMGSLGHLMTGCR